MFEINEILSPDLQALTAIGSVFMFNDNIYRICAGPAAAVKVAVVKALNKMRIKVASIDKESGEDVIFAVSGDRRVEVRVEALDPRSARMRIRAQIGESSDVQTATEVIACTERLLAMPTASVA